MRYIVGKLEGFSGQPVACSHMKYYPDGFAGDIDSPVPFAGLLQVSWFGRIGVTVLGHNEETHVEASVFMRGAGERLVTIAGEAFLLLEYKELSPGEFGWTAPKWQEDEFGEYKQWE